MLRKLLKYDLKYMLKNMTAFYALSIFAAILVRIFSSLNQTTIINIINQVCVGVLISMIASTIVNTDIRSWVRFSMSLYGDESYLSHTLPVSRKELFEAKFLQSIIFTLVGFLVTIVSLLIAFASKENFDLIRESLKTITDSLDINLPLFLTLTVILIFLEMLCTIQAGFMGIIIGHRFQVRKKLFSFIFGLIVYMGIQTLSLIFLLIMGIFNNGIMDMLIYNNPIDFNVLTIILIAAFIVYSLVLVVINIVSVKLFQKKVNIE